MADVSVTINPPNSTSVTIGNAVSAHGATHAPGSSDSLESYYYPRTNPSGYATSGDFATTGYVGEVSGYLSSQITSLNDVVLTTGDQTIDGSKSFLIRPNVNGTGVLLSGEITIVNTGYLTGYVQKFETGNFISSYQTGSFYPSSNPSGFITGVNLSAYQTVSASTGISGYLQNQISAINLSSGQFLTTGAADSRYLTEENDPVFSSSAAYLINSTLTGQWGQSYSDSITGVSVDGTSSKTITLYQRDGSTLTASFSDIEGTGGSATDYFLTGASFNSGNGNLNLYVNNGSTIIVSIEGRYITGNVVRPNETGSFITSGDLSLYQTIFGSTGISGYLQSQISNINLTPTGAFLTTGAADSRYYSLSNPSGYLTSANIADLATTGYVTGVSGYIQSQISAIRDGTGTFVSFSQTGNFYPSSNPSGFITGVNLTPYQTIAGSTGISGYLQGQISSIGSSTGLFVTGQVVRPTETGSFLTGVDLSTYATIALTTGISGYQSELISSLYGATGLYALKSNTGEFLTTGDADLRFYPLSSNPSGYLTSSSIADLATIGYVTGVSGNLQNQILILNSFSGQSSSGYSRSITGIAVNGTSTKTITLYQQNGSTLTADFSDLQGTGGESSNNAVLLTGDQNISGAKNFASRPTVNGTGVLLSGEVSSSSFNGVQWNFISSTSISNNSSVSLQLTGGYSRYMIGFKNVYASLNGYEFRARCSSDGGSSYFTGTSDYNYGYGMLNVYSPTQLEAAYIALSPLLPSKPSGGAFGHILFETTGSSSEKPSCKWDISHETYNTNHISYYLGASLVNRLTGINTVQFFASLGNLSGGSLNVYGSNY